MEQNRLTDEEFRSRVLAARQMSPEEKFLAGPRLFDQECERIRVELRRDNPGLNSPEIESLLRARLEQQRRREEAGLYVSTIEEAIVVVAGRIRAHPSDRDLLRSRIMEYRDRIDWDRVHSWCDEHGTRELLDEIRRSIPPI